MNNETVLQKSNFQLVAHHVEQSHATLWIGNLTQSIAHGFCCELVLSSNGCVLEKRSINSWQNAFCKSDEGFYALAFFEGLGAASEIVAELYAGGELIAQTYFKTLPARLPVEGEKPFTIALASCFSNQDDNGQFAAAFCDVAAQPQYSPDTTFLVGDQVYVDLGFQSLLPIPSLMRNRMRGQYQKNWAALQPVFSRTAVRMLPDDHEYWNDYPFNELPILALQTLKLDYFRRAWVESAKSAVETIQQSRRLDVINIGDELSICLADLRTERHAGGFIAEEKFKLLDAWARNLKCPGVLVIQQLLLDEVGGGERNLVSFASQYSRLVQALTSANQHILILTGDVHFGRVAQVYMSNGKQLVEVAASPVSNLKGFFNGLGAGVAVPTPLNFPSIAVDGVAQVPVNYSKNWMVKGIKGSRFSNYPKDRTKEHFSTISFSKTQDGVLRLEINYWLVREGRGAILAFDAPAIFQFD